MNPNEKTLWQIRDSVIDELRGGYRIDDNRIDPEFVVDKVNDMRARLLESYIKENGPDESMYQYDCCLEIVCEDIKCDGRILKQQTIVNISPLLSVAGKLYIRFVGSQDFTTSFSYLPMQSIQNSGEALWTKSTPTYTPVGINKLLLRNLPTEGMKWICVVSIYSNPNISCKDWKEKPYPIPAPLRTKLEYDLVQMLIKPMLLVNPEQRNNATDDMPESPDRRK